MIRRNRVLGVVGALLLLAVGTGCGSKVSGTALASVCAKHRLTQCLDYEPTPPGNEVVLRVWVEEGWRKAASMLCSALPNEKLNRLMGEGNEHYRYLSSARSGSCNIVTEQSGPQNNQQFSIELSMRTKTLRDYETTGHAERTEVSGHPARIERGGQGVSRSVKYTIATGTSPNTGGVLFVRTKTESARGVYTDSELDYSHMNSVRSAVAESYVAAVLE